MKLIIEKCLFGGWQIEGERETRISCLLQVCQNIIIFCNKRYTFHVPYFHSLHIFLLDKIAYVSLINILFFILTILNFNFTNIPQQIALKCGFFSFFFLACK